MVAINYVQGSDGLFPDAQQSTTEKHIFFTKLRKMKKINVHFAIILKWIHGKNGHNHI